MNDKVDECDEQLLELEQCEIRCPRCDTNWVTSLSVEWGDCLNCGTKLRPLKHVVVGSETEVN